MKIKERGHLTWKEIQSQPEALQATHTVMRDRFSQLTQITNRYQRVFWIGSGLSFNTAEIARDIHVALTGKDSFAISAGELFKRNGPEIPVPDEHTLLVPISRTGNTTEVLEAVKQLKEINSACQVVGITTNKDSMLLKQFPETIVLPITEKSITQTSAFTSMLLAAHELSAMAGRTYGKYQEGFNSMGRKAKELLQKFDGVAKKTAQKDQNIIFFLGRGPRHGIAKAGSVTVMEMAHQITISDKFMDFPHDTITLADSSSLVNGFISDGDSSGPEIYVLEKSRERGAETIALFEKPTQKNHKVNSGEKIIFLATGVPEEIRAPLLHIWPQVLGYHVAIARNLDPDKPDALQPVVIYHK